MTIDNVTFHFSTLDKEDHPVGVGSVEIDGPYMKLTVPFDKPNHKPTDDPYYIVGKSYGKQQWIGHHVGPAGDEPILATWALVGPKDRVQHIYVGTWREFNNLYYFTFTVEQVPAAEESA